MNLWDRLLNSQKTINLGNRDVTFKQLFDEYNNKIGNSLTRLKEQPQPIEGRDKEIEMLYAVLERPKTPVALLLGLAGVGKTALVEEFGKQLNSGQYNTKLKNKYLLLSLRLGNLSSIGNSKMNSELSQMLDVLKNFETIAQQILNDPTIRIVLFIDEVHMLVTIFGPGTKIGGDVIKDVLARSPIRVIAATTRREYDSTIIVDKPLSERFKQIEMSELAPEIVEKICVSWWKKIEPNYAPPDIDIIRRVIHANAAYRPDSAEPRKSLDILEDFVSYVRRTGKPITNEIVDKIFKDRYAINLSFRVNPDEIYEEIEKRIKGQPHALYVLKRLLRSTIYQADPNSNKPIFTTLFTGSTGTGKTETVKAIANKLYPGENVLLNINMPDYKTPEHEESFRKRLGEYVRHVPNAIILLDEFEKADESIRDAMLTILDEGLITFTTVNREGVPEVNTVSLRNTIVIATTNAGHQIFKNDAAFSQRSIIGNEGVRDARNKAEIDQLMKDLVPFLQTAGFKPEMLGRFKKIVPYRGLSEETFITITENELNKIIERFYDINGITIELNEPKQWSNEYNNAFTTDVAIYIAYNRADATNPNSGGARSIKREIDDVFIDSIVECMADNPDCKHFKVSVSQETNIYTQGAAASDGGIIVNAVY